MGLVQWNPLGVTCRSREIPRIQSSLILSPRLYVPNSGVKIVFVVCVCLWWIFVCASGGWWIGTTGCGSGGGGWGSGGGWGCGGGWGSGGRVVWVFVLVSEMLMGLGWDVIVSEMLSVHLLFFLWGPMMSSGLTGGTKPVHSMAPTRSILSICERTEWHIFAVATRSSGPSLLIQLGLSAQMTLVIRWSLRHLVTNFLNSVNPTPPSRYDLMAIASIVPTASSSSIKSCVFAAELPDAMCFLVDFGKRTNVFRVPRHAHVPTPDKQTQFNSIFKCVLTDQENICLQNRICTYTVCKQSRRNK